MTDEYNRELCGERHMEIDRRLERREEEEGELHGRIDDVIAAVNGTFTRLMYWIMGTMAASLGGTITLAVLILMERVKK